MTATVNDTARSLLAFFGTMAEWGERGTIGIHDASPELMALACAILDIVPAAWSPYGEGRTDGWVDLYQPNPDRDMGDAGFSPRRAAVHSVSRPPRWVAPDGGHASNVAIVRATVAALVGLAGHRRPTVPADVHRILPRMHEDDIHPSMREPGCARVMATLTDEDIEQAERGDDRDSIGGE